MDSTPRDTLLEGADQYDRLLAEQVQRTAALEQELEQTRARLATLDPWQEFYRYPLDDPDPALWQINTGSRPAVDSSSGQKAMTQFGPDGLRLSAQPAGAKIASCDVISKHPLPRYRAVEMDLEFTGYLGSGMFPCPYWSKGGGGEFDGVEHMGALAGTNMQWKMTAIALPAGSPLVQVQKALVPFFRANGIDPAARNTWRWEHTDGKAELLIRGLSVATITRDEFDGPGPIMKGSKTPLWPAKPGRWDTQFEDPAKTWYTRHTWQVGPRADGKAGGMGGTVPADWTGSSFLISRMVAYVPRTTA